MRIPVHFTLIPILLAGGSGLLTAQTVSVSPTSLTLSAQFQGSPATAPLAVNSTPGFTVFVGPCVGPQGSTSQSSTQCLKVNGPGQTPGSAATLSTSGTVTVTADPANPTVLQVGAYTAALTVIQTGSATQVQVPVTITVSPIGVSPSSITFAPYTVGGSTIPPSQSITLSGTGGFTASVTSNSPWLSVVPANGTAPGVVTATLNTNILLGLAANTYTGTITVTPSASTSTPINVPVTLQVLPTPPVTLNPASLIINVQQNGTNNVTTQVLNISTTPGQQLSYSITPSYTSGSNWLTLNPTSGTTDMNTGTAQITVGYNLAGLTVGNSYQATITVFTPGGTPTQKSVPVTLNYSATPLLNVPTNTLNFTAQLGGSKPAPQNVNITATSGTLAYNFSVSAVPAGWLSAVSTLGPTVVPPNAGNTSGPIAVSVDQTGLGPGTYSGSVSVTLAGGTTQQIPVVLKVTNDPILVTNVDSMSFPFQVGQQPPAAQNLKITSSNGVPLAFTATASSTTCGNNWLQFVNTSNPVSGNTDASIMVGINTTGLTAATCTGTINITGSIVSTGAAVASKQITVTLLVSTTPQMIATPTSLSFSVAAGGQSPAPQTITLSSTSTDLLNYSLAGVSQGNAPTPWLSASPTQGSTTSNNMLSVFVFTSSLPAGTYNGSVTLGATASDGKTALVNSPVTIPVVLTVTSGSLTLTPAQLNFAYTLGGSSPATQTVTVGSSNQALVFTAVATSTAQNPWLSVTPTSGNTTGSGTLTVAVDGTKLTAAGTYNGSITITSPGAGNSPATVPVTVVVSPGTISAPTTTLSFSQVAGGAAPPQQTIAVTGSPSSLAFTVAATTTPAGGTWLSASPASGNTPGTVSVSANGTGLSVGQYTGQVVITSSGANGSPITVPVVLNILAPSTITTTPTSLNFSYTIGLQTPASVTLTVNSSSPVLISTTVQFSGPASWLTVTPTQSTAPANLTVAVQPANLAAGTYTGSITINSPNVITGATVPVTLTVLAIPTPVIKAVDNAGSYLNGPLSPGENIVIFGSGIGPATLVSNGLTNNAFGPIVGSTRVLFDGVPAPMIYASATQTSAMVPYGVFGRTTTNVVVEYSGVQSAPLSYNVASAAPGIYTLNQQGTGAGAILNQDGVTVNSPGTPEKRGNVVSVYMTGEGQTSPAGVDGSIIPPMLSALKKPILTVTATVGGVAAQVAYAGSAAGLVSGVMQVNLIIPADAPTGGSVPIVVTVGTTSSQPGVTLAVQ